MRAAAGEAIGLFGGSFDPVHNAHLGLAQAALAALPLRLVRWLPNSVPGHREGPQAGAAERLAMLELALGQEPRFAIDQSELWRSEPTYSIDTLRRLRLELGMHVPLVFIIGADHLLALDRWHHWEELFNLTHFAIAERPGHEIRETTMTGEVAAQLSRRSAAADTIGTSPCGCMVRFPCPPLDISSTAIRGKLAARNGAVDTALEKLCELLPAAVLDYIQSRNLYRINT